MPKTVKSREIEENEKREYASTILNGPMSAKTYLTVLVSSLYHLLPRLWAYVVMSMGTGVSMSTLSVFSLVFI